MTTPPRPISIRPLVILAHVRRGHCGRLGPNVHRHVDQVSSLELEHVNLAIVVKAIIPKLIIVMLGNAPLHWHGLNGLHVQPHVVMEHKLERDNVLLRVNVMIIHLMRHENVLWKDAQDGDYGQNGVIVQLLADHQLKHETEIVSTQLILRHVWP